MKILVTGGAGFIGSAVCRHLIAETDHSVVNVDKLTYSSNLASLREIGDSDRYAFVKRDICDRAALLSIMESHGVEAILHLAAESHVDRSIDAPADFIQTNIVGTYQLLEAARAYWQRLDGRRKSRFRFHHVSTDEVYGWLPLDSGMFLEESPYRPSSPYSASKAASDHLVLAWYHTYGLPALVSNSSNNYGPFQFPEKLIPLITINALEGKPLPVYGQGENIRDWIHVEDHARALLAILTKGEVGGKYNVGGRSERSNLTVVKTICDVLDRVRPNGDGSSHHDLIRFVSDRPGHDLRYAIDPQKIEDELGWNASESFEDALENTVRWYLANEAWWRPIREHSYGGERIGTGTRAKV